jgi:hypothetical protein
MQRRSVVSSPVWLHDDLDILIERHEEAQQPLNRKLSEFAAQHLGDVRLFDAEKISSFDLFQTTISDDCVDFENELRLDQVLLGIWQADLLKYVRAPVEHIPARGLVFLPHVLLSFAMRSASRRRRLINSMSGRAVSRPLFDFF